jgi:muconolactone delta-isomerase
MEYLVTMTTHVPEGTPEQAVEDVRAREAARSRELAAQRMLMSLPLGPWTVQTTPLSRHLSDPASRS